MKIKNGLKSDKHNGYKPKEERSEQVQADHELFLQAFESKSVVKMNIGCKSFHFRADSNLQISADPESYFSPLPQPEPDLHEKADVEK